MFCCDGFKNLVSLAGERGLAILVREESSGHISFVFQSRGVAFQDIGKLKPIPIDIKINIDAITGLQYCSACGTRMEEVVQENPEFFKELAIRHRKFLAATPGL